MAISSPIDFSDGRFDETVRASFADVQALGGIPQRVQDYLARSEVDPTGLITDPDAFRRRMWQYLRTRGVKFKDNPLPNDDTYDEILFSAYDAALKTERGGADPLVVARSGTEFDAAGAWDFTVEPFETIEDQGVSQDSVRAAGAIDYIYEIGERMGVFRIADALVLNWSSGAIDVADGDAAGKLYRYWKEMDDRSDRAERGMLYKRVLNKGGANVLSRMVVNESFPHLWSALMGEVARYIDKSERVDSARDSSPVSVQPIYSAVRELQYNLTEYCSGMAFMQTRELYAQLQRAFEILRDPDIIAHFGGPRRRNMWRAIETLAKQEFQQSLPIAPLVRVAVDGNRVFQLVAAFDEATFTPDQFNQLRDAAESYIINASVVDAQLGGSTLAEEDDAEADEDFDTGDGNGEDEFDDF
jgi:hypothetical protein